MSYPPHHHHRDESPPPADGIRRSMRQLGHDVLALTELQYELLQVELREFAGKVVAPALILAAGAMALGVGATPIALLALGYVLADAF
ncbi:MAG TPA: hypothetical protein PJ982_04620, partial [Lacipirellulaceae bacterium]|nr:hypothetical protein [Lacipirellulaceae bacterium]